MWSILSSPEYRFGAWDTDVFFATGEAEAAGVHARLDELGGLPALGAALDFGCGLGRVTRAFATRFDHVVGVDISETMLVKARDLNADAPNIEFVHNAAADLTVLGDQRFDLVYCRIVLQHQPSREVARGYVDEFVGLLKPGGRLVFQIPMNIPRRYRLLVVRRLYTTLRAVGVAPKTLYDRLHLHPISMLFVPEDELRGWLSGVRIDAIDRASDGPVLSGTIYATARAVT